MMVMRTKDKTINNRSSTGDLKVTTLTLAAVGSAITTSNTSS